MQPWAKYNHHFVTNFVYNNNQEEKALRSGRAEKKASYVSLGELKLICGVLSQVLGGQI